MALVGNNPDWEDEEVGGIDVEELMVMNCW